MLFGQIGCREEQGVIIPGRQAFGPPSETQAGLFRVDATPAQRFPKYADRSGLLRYIAGSAWAELTPTRFRSLNFAFGPDGVGECYVSSISGFVDAGLSNVNRWRGQMNLGPMTGAELAALPKKPFAGEESPFVKLDGTFTGMNASGERPGYRMLAMLMTRGCEAYSVKMVGPKSLVEREEGDFLAFCETLDILPDPNADPYIQQKVGPFEFLRPCEWEYYLPESDAVVRRPVGFKIGPNGETLCKFGIIVDGGRSLTDVVNGWRETKGVEPLTEDEVIALPAAVLLGTQGREMEITINGKTFVGIVSELRSEGHEPMTILVTLEGPQEVVADERMMFRTFASSLRLGPVSGASGGSAPHP